MNARKTESLRCDADGRTWFGAGSHRVVQGIHVLDLRGTPYEMGRQHGALLKAQIPDGPIFYFRDYVEKLVKSSGLGILTPLVRGLLRQTVGRTVARKLPDYARASIRGMADGSGLKFADVLDGCTMPDSLMWVVARMIQARRVGPAVQHRLALSLGCTSAIAWGSATADGRLLHARNLDYHGVEAWPKHTAVIFHTPDQGHRYVSVASAGVLMGGATAMNDQGLTLTVHQHMFTDGTRLGGTPIGTVGDQVMREASTLAEAEAILRQYRSIGCWTYLIADAKTNEVLCFEENPRRQVGHKITKENERFGYANIYLDPELGATERDLYPSYWRHNVGRQQRANTLLQRPGMTPTDMAGILADEGRTDCRIRDSICMLMTVASVVFRPEDGTLWVGTGEAPTSQNPFLAFSLAACDVLAGEAPLFPGAQADPARQAAFRLWRDAYVARVDRGEDAEARRLVEAACAAQPEQPLYHYISGLLALEVGEAHAAEQRLDQALALGHPDPERVASFHLWRGRARDLQGRRDAAVQDYQRALAGPVDPAAAKAARRGLARAHTLRKGARIGVDFSFADVVMP
ncbi:MAG: C45 family autoproteolytic acyltransferase/hydrolase [bacterium]